MRPQLLDGWFVVPFDGPDRSVVTLSFGNAVLPVFFDYVGGQRVVQARPDRAGGCKVTMTVNGTLRDLGRFTL